MPTYVCVPRPGSALPPIDVKAPTRLIARLRLAEELRLRDPAWRHAAYSYQILAPSDFEQV